MEFADEQIAWRVDGKSIELGLTRSGNGSTLLMLPALSSISTRAEMRPIDWPGFGTWPRPKIAWRPDHYRAFLRFVTAEVVQPSTTIAAGHAAGYALAQAADDQGSMGRLVLLSPTWRGPLPTMTGKRAPWFGRVARAVDLPLVGAGLYRLNVNGPVIGMMARGHVYSDPAWLTPERLAQKRAVTEAPGARHASFRFVAGELDLFTDRDTFLDAARRARSDIVVAYGSEAPPKSKAELTALAALENVSAVELPRGKLSFYEEFPDDTAQALRRILDG